jgi:hypothetical protein
MPLLVRSKRNVARGIKSGALMADSKPDRALHLSFGHPACWSLTERARRLVVGRSVAALIMVPIIVKEAIEGLRGETCCDDD